MEKTNDTSLSEEQVYMQRLRIANAMVEAYLRENLDYDRADLFRIAMNSFKTPDELLAAGLRRRVIGGN